MQMCKDAMHNSKLGGPTELCCFAFLTQQLFSMHQLSLGISICWLQHSDLLKIRNCFVQLPLSLPASRNIASLTAAQSKRASFFSFYE